MCNPGDDQRGQGASYARAAVEDSHSNAALLAGKPLGNRLAGARPVEAFSNPQQKSKCGKTGNRTGETGEDVHHRPEAYRQSQAESGAHSIEEDASQKPCNRIGNLKSTENPTQIRMAEVVLTGQHGSKHGEGLPADVIGDRRKEERPDNPPTRSAGSPNFMRG